MKAILICNGDAPSRDFLMKILENYDSIACADGGANLAYKFKIQPDFIIGDLDSIEERVKNFFQGKGSEIILDTDQDSTDIEKSVKFLINRGYTSIDIVSALGDRIDHNLGNLSVLVNYHRKAKLRIIWEDGEVFFATDKFSFEVNKGDVISLIPLGRKALISKTIGLKFKLKNESLVFSGRGVSNVAVANRVSIYVKRGGVFVIRKIIRQKSMMVSFAIEDIVIIISYFIGVLYIGFKAKGENENAVEEYLLAGRSLTLPMFVATLVSTWYGGILGVGEFTYKHGLSVWLVLGLPYYIFGAIFAFVLAGRVRRSKLFTIPDRLAQVYDKKTSFFGTILTLILVTPAPYFLMLGVLFQIIFGLDLKLSIIISTLLSVSYLFVGGFKSDVYTDIFEFFLMFVGFGLILPFAFTKYGGIDFIVSNVPKETLTLTGGNSIQYIIAWFLIAVWTLVDPGFYQRCYAAKDEKTAKYGILVSILFWMVFDFMTITAGLYSKAILPNLDQPVMAYPLLAEVVLPKIAKGLFYVGLLATIMSTLNTLVFISAVTIGNDIIWKLKGNHGEVNKINFYTRIGLVITSVSSILLAIYFPSVVDLWYIIGTLTIPGLLIPVITSYFENLTPTPKHAFLIMVSGFIFSFVSFVMGQIFKTPLGEPNYPFGLEPMFPGLIVSILIYIIGRLFRGKFVF